MIAAAAAGLALGCGVVTVRRAQSYDRHFWAEAGCRLAVRGHETAMRAVTTEASGAGSEAERDRLLEEARAIGLDAEAYRRRADWHHRRCSQYGAIDRFISRLIAPSVRE